MSSIRPPNCRSLEFALTSLWNYQAEQGSPLTHQAYKAIGGCKGALAHYADRVYSLLTQSEQGQARRVLMKVIQPGIGAEDTSRISRRDELDTAEWQMAQRLADLRLVVTDRGPDGQDALYCVRLDPRVEPTTRWLNGDRAFRTWQERLRPLHNSWGNPERMKECCCAALCSPKPTMVSNARRRHQRQKTPGGGDEHCATGQEITGGASAARA